MAHPIKHASDIAQLIRLDPISAGMIKECIPASELRDLLGIDKTTEEIFEGLSNEEIWNEVFERVKVGNYVMSPELVAALILVKGELL